MIFINENFICEQARPHYYDYLWEELRESIPAEMLSHIDKCRHCQAEVNRLKIILAEAGSARQTTSAITTVLRLHFAYTKALVTCETVRAFLPSLADPALEVGVPTPITVHLDKCQQCADDLEIIQQLNLSHKQLCRLGQLFAEKPAEDCIGCSQTPAAVSAVVTMVFPETNTNVEVLKHLCICPDCRELLYKYRETVREELLLDRETQEEFPCEAVSAKDIFDYVVPYGIDPANDQYAKFRPAFTSHARACPKCFGKMQELHSTVYSILEHRESGIVTCFKMFDESARDSIVSSPNDVYLDWPIEVEVLDKSKPEPETIAFPQRPGQKVSAMNLRKFRMPAAAIILIAIGLFFLSTPAAKAVDLGQIYRAFDRVKNICVTAFVPEESKPTQEIWISRPLKIKMFKTETECVLLDIEGKYRKVRDLNIGSITMAELDEDRLVKIEKAIKGTVGLLPFDDISEKPEDAKWQHVTDETIKTIVPGTQVYDLTWTEKTLDGKIVHRKWRGYINTETKLPKRVEQWRKYTGEEYKLLIIMKTAYPATVEVQAAISNAGF